MQITFEIDGAKELSAELGLKAGKLKDYRKPMQKIGTNLVKTFKDNITTGGSTLGVAWPPRKKDQPWPMLMKTGKLHGGFTAKAGKDEVVVGNPVPYFVFHQRGTRHLPKRVMMKLDQERKTMIIKEIQKYVSETVGVTRG